MNAEIETALANLVVNNVTVAVAYMEYHGHGEPYVVYRQYDKDNTYATEDKIAGFVTYYDFDVYSKGNYLAIVEEIKARLEPYFWTWEPSRDSPDMYDTDTRYYHKTVCLCKPVQT